MSIITKRGDSGFTSMLGGTGHKSSLMFDVIGEFDHLNSYLGLFVNKSTGTLPCNEINFLIDLQHKIFKISSYIISNNNEKYLSHDDVIELITSIEKYVYESEEILPKLTRFILPSGHELACHAHIIRTHVRKLERLLWYHALNIDSNIKVLFNRLSDYFFTMARNINHRSFIDEEIIVN